MSKKPSLIFIIFITFFCCIVISSLLRSIFLEQQRELILLEDEIQNIKDIIIDLENIISYYQHDARIIEIAKNELDMEFPEPSNIISVKMSQISSDHVSYSIMNFISPEAIAAQNK